MKRADPHHDPTPASLPAPSKSPPSPTLSIKPLDEAILALMREAEIPSVCVALAFKGRLTHARGYGQGVPTRPQLLCSLSKPLTAQACFLLIQEGKLHLETPLKSILPAEGAAGRITLRQLLTHRSGLPSSHTELAQELKGRTDLPRREGVLYEYELVCHALTKPLRFTPGADFLYSSLGYQVLGRVIEAVAGQRADLFLQARVLRPLGIESYISTTYLRPKDLASLDYLPLPARLQVLSQTAWGCNDMAGAACLSPLDYLRFLARFRPMLTPETLRQLQRPAGSGYGLGWQLREGTVQGRPVVGVAHTGIWTRETHLATSWSHGACSVCFVESAKEDTCAQLHALVQEACLQLSERAESAPLDLSHALE